MKGQEQPHGDDLSEWQGSLSGVDVQREDREPHGVDRCEGDGPRGPQAGRTQDMVLRRTLGECTFPLWKPVHSTQQRLDEHLLKRTEWDQSLVG